MGEPGEGAGGRTAVGALPVEEGDSTGGQRRVEGDGDEAGVVVGDGVGQDGGQAGALDDLGERLDGVRLDRDAGSGPVAGEVGVDVATGGEVAAEQREFPAGEFTDGERGTPPVSAPRGR